MTKVWTLHAEEAELQIPHYILYQLSNAIPLLHMKQEHKMTRRN